MTAPTSLTHDLAAELQGAPLQQIAQQLGIGQSEANAAVGAALPLLLGALGRNASEPQGAQALLGALEKDHAGGGNDLTGLLGSILGGAQTRQTNGAGILGHIFGARQDRAQAGLGQATGLGGDKSGQLLRMLAPIVLSFLAKQVLQGKNNAQAASPSADILGSMLGREQQQVRQQGGVGGGLLAAVLDQDGDGQLGINDLMKLGGNLFGGRQG
ncbi:MAG: DUF937 domain-containing protein [Gemmatimonadales bacterium]